MSEAVRLYGMRRYGAAGLVILGAILLGVILGLLWKHLGASGAEVPPPASRAAGEPEPAPAPAYAAVPEFVEPLVRAASPAPQTIVRLIPAVAAPPVPTEAPAGPVLRWPPPALAMPAFGDTYVDPIFGTTIRRVTSDEGLHSQSDIYVKNGFWNADGTLMMHKRPGNRHIINTKTGAVVRATIPGSADSSFDPVDPDIWYYWSGNSLATYHLGTGQSSTLKTFDAALGPLGGSVDWIDASGRYFLLNIGGSLRVWDKESDTLYAGAAPADLGGGWAGISPDGAYVIKANREKYSFKIDHGAKTLSTNGVLFWTLCGDHGDVITASNGKTYMVTFECHDQAAAYRVDVTLAQSNGNVRKQQQENKMLFDTGWPDSGHFSCAAKGARRDWCFVSVSSGDDTFDKAGGARPYKSAIIAVNVLTGEVRELAHHRSKSTNESYYYHPRVSASWTGNEVAWASNFGQSGVEGYSDLYVLETPR